MIYILYNVLRLTWHIPELKEHFRSPLTGLGDLPNLLWPWPTRCQDFWAWRCGSLDLKFRSMGKMIQEFIRIWFKGMQLSKSKFQSCEAKASSVLHFEQEMNPGPRPLGIGWFGCRNILAKVLADRAILPPCVQNLDKTTWRHCIEVNAEMQVPTWSPGPMDRYHQWIWGPCGWLCHSGRCWVDKLQPEGSAQIDVSPLALPELQFQRIWIQLSLPIWPFGRGLAWCLRQSSGPGASTLTWHCGLEWNGHREVDDETFITEDIGGGAAQWFGSLPQWEPAKSLLLPNG